MTATRQDPARHDDGREPSHHGRGAGAPAPSSEATAPAVRTTGLVKAFGSHHAVDGIDLHVPRGAVYGFLGPNGSGKTTTIRMLLGLVRPTSGSIEMLGEPMPHRAASVLTRVGSLVEGPAFHGHLSGRANLARLDAVDACSDPRTSRERIDTALRRVGLQNAAEKRFRAYSLGMRQRLALAAALLSERDLLVLDEPTNGLDPQGTREIRHLIGDLHAEGVTVLVSSHLLSEIEQVCTHLGVMRAGRVVAQGTVEEIRALAPTQVRVNPTEATRGVALDVLRGLGLTDLALTESTTGPVITGACPEVPPERIVATLVEAGVGVRGFDLRPARLEDLFVSLTGEGFDVSR